MSILIDTNVLREIWHPNGNASVKSAVATLDSSATFLSVITIGEVVRGVLELPQGAKRLSLSRYLSLTEADFGDRILPVTREIAHRWGELTARTKKAGHILPPTDGLIAATALQHGLAVMTRNARDFVHTGVTVIDPWAER